uniref:Uncharacterized protein n=1 Tax=Ditylenchus dipsaci TaxID=166011 RepID=A0A915D600_9BILA
MNQSGRSHHRPDQEANQRRVEHVCVLHHPASSPLIDIYQPTACAYAMFIQRRQPANKKQTPALPTPQNCSTS